MKKSMMRKLEDLMEQHVEELVIELLKEDILNMPPGFDIGSKFKESMLDVLGYYMTGREYEDFIRENNLKKDD